MLYLHIGCEDAAASAIQFALARNDEALHALAVRHVHTPRVPHCNALVPLLLAARSAAEVAEAREAKAILASLERDDGAITLVSADRLHTLPAPAVARLRELLAGVAVRIVVVLQPQQQALAALLGRPAGDLPLQDRLAGSDPAQVAGSRLDYLGLLERWSVFGRANIAVLTHDPATTAAADTADRLLATLGIPAPVRADWARAPEPPPLPPAVMAPACRDILARGNAAVARDWLGRAEGDLFRPPSPEPLPHGRAPATRHVVEDVLLAVRLPQPASDADATIGAFTADGRVLAGGNRPHHRSHDIWPRRPVDPAHWRDAPVLAGTHTYLGVWAYHFGHFLCETLPMLMYAAQAAGDLVFLPYQVRVTPGLQPNLHDAWAAALVRAAGVDPARIRIATTPLRAQRLVVPARWTATMGGPPPAGMAGFMRRVGRRLEAADPGREALPQRIYFSRRGVRDNARRLLNEDAVERWFEARGFVCVQPESLPLERQVRLVRNASWIAGLDGSALHLSLFMRPDSRMVMLGLRPGIANVIRKVNALQQVDCLAWDLSPLAAAEGVRPGRWNHVLQDPEGALDAWLQRSDAQAQAALASRT